jgi:uncharacterized protein (DUF736 family)
MEQKNNTITIFKNDKKTAENQPDYKGKMMVDGKMKDVSLWVREAASGIKYMNGPVQDPYVKPEEQQQAPVSTSKKIQDATEDDGLPF